MISGIMMIFVGMTSAATFYRESFDNYFGISPQMFSFAFVFLILTVALVSFIGRYKYR